MNGKRKTERSYRLLSSRILVVAALVAPTLAGGLIASKAHAQSELPQPLVNASVKGMETSTIVDGITNSSGRGDRLAVTVARIAGYDGKPANTSGDMDIWVGEVELQGRKTVWVELIDSYGEVIYDSEVKKNETHLLPDGRAIVVRALPDGTRYAKAETDRIATDANLVVTRRVVNDENNAATVEFFQENTTSGVKPDKEDTALVAVAKFSERVWSAIVAYVSSAADNVRYAFRWLYDVVAA